MTTDDLNKAKQIIEGAQNISVLPSPEFQKDTFPAALGLFYSLKKLGKNVKLLTEDEPEKYKFLIDEEVLNAPQADFLISIKEAGARFSGLFYEKTPSGLNLFLKTNGGKLTEDDIALRPVEASDFEDLLITVGIADFAVAEKELAETETPIINIDNNPANNNYGLVNLTETGALSLAEIVFTLCCELNESPFDEQAANSLLAGIIEASQNLQKPELSSQTVRAINCLTEYGASLPAIRNELYGKLKNGARAIFARVLNKIKVVEEQGLAWAALSAADFQQTNSSAADLSLVLRQLASGLFPFENFLLLWEQTSSPPSVRGVFYSANKEWRHNISANFASRQKGEGVLFEVKGVGLEQAKNKVLSILNQY